MANTLNLGNGNWATKEDSLLAYNSENGNFKPLPFDFTRASSATVVNKQGLIETVGSGKPRIDFKDDAKGALLLEPQRMNLVTYSEKLSNWTQDGATTLDNNIISPDGTLNASKITFNSGNERVYTFTNTTNGSFSAYFKGVQGKKVKLRDNSGTYFTEITLTENWVRYYLYKETSNTNIQIQNIDADDVNVWGAQVEEGSYATSYIPNFGNSAGATRSADSNTTQVATNSVIGQTEGTIFYDINFNNIETSSQYIGVLSDGSSTNRIQFLNNISQDWQLFITASTISSNINLTTSATGVGRYKIAIAYKSGDVVFYVNGVQKGTSTETFTFSNLLHFDLGQRYDDSLFFNNPINNSKLYNTRLSNAELQALTQE